MAERKRIFVGGLFPGVTEEDLRQRFAKFGKVDRVEIKIRKDEAGVPNKTFAYIDGDFVESSLQNCFSIYNKSTWKGKVLKLQLAKESFLEKLKRERECPDKGEKVDSVETPVQVTCKREVKGAVPGTPVEGERNWVVGKFGIVLPVVYIRRKDKRKIMKIDPSKYCHNVKRMKGDNTEDGSRVRNLTWKLKQQDSDVVKRIKGHFPEFKPMKRVRRADVTVDIKSETTLVHENTKHTEKRLKWSMNSAANDSDDLQVVKMQPTPEPMSLQEKMLRIAGMEVAKEEKTYDSDSDNTDEIIALSKKPSHPDSTSYAEETSNSVCLMKVGPKSGIDSENRDKGPVRPANCWSEEEKGSSSLSSDSEQETLSEDRTNLIPCADKSKVSRGQKMKPFPFKGTKLMKGIDCQKTTTLVSKSSPEGAVALSVSGLDTHTTKSLIESPLTYSMSISDTQGSKLQNIDKPITCALSVPYCSSSASESEADENLNVPQRSAGRFHTRTFFSAKGNNSVPGLSGRGKGQAKASVSNLMDEFSSGLITAGDDLVLPDAAEDSSSSDSDYDSEDYEKLAAKTPKPKGLSMSAGSTPLRCGSLSKSVSQDDKWDVKLSNRVQEQGVHRSHLELNRTTGLQKAKKDVGSVTTVEGKKTVSNAKSSPNSSGIMEYNSDTAGSETSRMDSDSDIDSESVENVNESPVKCSVQGKKAASPTKQTAPAGKQMKISTAGVVKSVDDVRTGVSTVDKHNSDNQKRLLSLRQRQKEAQSQKSLIQEALKLVDSGSRSNQKIVFSSEDEEETPALGNKEKTLSVASGVENQQLKTKEAMHLAKEKTKLFESSSEDSGDSSDEMSDTEMFEIKPQFEGEAGKKLMDLQSRFGNDPRFKLDHRFIEADEKKGDRSESVETEASETTKMLQILRDVVGQKVPVEKEPSKKLFKGPVRYDPLKKDHGQFELKKEAKRKVKLVQLDDARSTKKETVAEEPPVVLPDVSEKRFYTVSSVLKDAFGQKDDTTAAGGFSLLANFGKAEAGKEKIQQTGEIKVVTSVQQQVKELFSSDGTPDLDKSVSEESTLRKDTQNSAPKLGCFFAKDDPRLKEAVFASFRQRDVSAIQKEWEENRPYHIDSYRSIHKRVSRRMKIARSKRGRHSNTR